MTTSKTGGGVVMLRFVGLGDDGVVDFVEDSIDAASVLGVADDDGILVVFVDVVDGFVVFDDDEVVVVPIDDGDGFNAAGFDDIGEDDNDDDVENKDDSFDENDVE